MGSFLFPCSRKQRDDLGRVKEVGEDNGNCGTNGISRRLRASGMLGRTIGGQHHKTR